MEHDLEEKIKACIRTVPDHPKPGIMFKDITPLFNKIELMKSIVRCMGDQIRSEGITIDAVAAVEARGFIFGALLAQELNCAFVPVRKSGKLPFSTEIEHFDLEYGTASIEIHTDAIQPGWKVLIHDDLLATGGTASAAARLVRRVGGTIQGFLFLVNLAFLPGEKLILEQFGMKPRYLVQYNS